MTVPSLSKPPVLRESNGFTKMTAAEKAFQVFNYIFLTLLALVMLLPFYIVIINSFSPPIDYLQKDIILWPSVFEFTYYKWLLGGAKSDFLVSLGNTGYLVLIGTSTNIVLTFLVSYILAQKGMPFRTQITFLFVFTMFFSGGLIPHYILRRELGMLNSLNGLVIGGLIGTTYVLYLRNFLMTIPVDLIESAHVDGCPEFTLLIRIILPLSLPALATFTLFYAVNWWNSFGGPRIYITTKSKMPIQVYLFELINSAKPEGNEQELSKYIESGVKPPPEALKAAAIVCATVPIVIIYPFLQKYFVKGMMMGSLKG